MSSRRYASSLTAVAGDGIGMISHLSFGLSRMGRRAAILPKVLDDYPPTEKGGWCNEDGLRGAWGRDRHT